MSTLHDRLANVFMKMQHEIKMGSDARAFAMFERTVKVEIKKAKERKK